MSATVEMISDEMDRLRAEIERLREERRRLRALAVIAESLVNHVHGVTFQTLANAVTVWRHPRRPKR